MEHAVGEARQHFDEAAADHRAQREHAEHRPDAGVPERVEVPFQCLAQHAAVSEAGAALGCDHDTRETQRKRNIGERIQGKAERHRSLSDRDAGDRGADEPCVVEDDRVDRHRRWQGLPIDQVRDEREPRGLCDRIGGAQHERQQKQGPDRDRTGICQQGQQERLADRHHLGHPDHPNAVAPVGERARDRAQEHYRRQIGEGHQAKPGAGVRQLPGEPAHGDPLQPDADQRDRVAEGIDAVIADAERAHDVAEATRGRLNPHCSTRLLLPLDRVRRCPGSGQSDVRLLSGLPWTRAQRRRASSPESHRRRVASGACTRECYQSNAVE